MNNKYIIIYCPNEKISTAEAYNSITPKKGNYNLKEVLENENLENWNKYVKNDFEPYALKKIKGLKNMNFKGIKINSRGNDKEYFIHIRTKFTLLPWQYYQGKFSVNSKWQEIKINLSE